MTRPGIGPHGDSPRTLATDYQVLLLRLWRERVASPDPVWRCSVEDPATRHRRGFDSVEELTIFLRELTERPSTARPAVPDEVDRAGHDGTGTSRGRP